MEDVGISYANLVYFVSIRYLLSPFGIFYGYLVHFIPCWSVVQIKIWQPWSDVRGGTLF
jgi:hypothetical protein